MTDLNVFIALGAGFLSFVSPSLPAIISGFLSYITGMSVGRLKKKMRSLQRRSMLHTLFFLIGFSAIFIAIGFGTTLLGQFFQQYQDLIRQIGAIFVFIFGLLIVGIIRPEFLMKERRFEFKNRPSGLLGSVLIGMAFAAGWTPCTGPILGAVWSLAVTNPNSAIVYMIAYILGFAIPFFVLSFFIGKMQWIRRNSAKIMKIGGLLMMIMGVVLFFNWMTKIIIFLSPLFGGFTGF